MSFPKFVYMTKNTPLFSNFARFCTPKWCTRLQYLVLKNNPNYMNFGQAWYPLDIPVAPLGLWGSDSTAKCSGRLCDCLTSYSRRLSNHIIQAVEVLQSVWFQVGSNVNLILRSLYLCVGTFLLRACVYGLQDLVYACILIERLVKCAFMSLPTRNCADYNITLMLLLFSFCFYCKAS